MDTTEQLHFHFYALEKEMATHSSVLVLENHRDGVSQSRTRLSNFTFTFHFYALEKEMATHSSVLVLENRRDGVSQSQTRLK